MVGMCKNCIALCVEDEVLHIGDEVVSASECECKGKFKEKAYFGDMNE